jgi:hypothetical protein
MSASTAPGIPAEFGRLGGSDRGRAWAQGNRSSGRRSCSVHWRCGTQSIRNFIGRQQRFVNSFVALIATRLAEARFV